jgi:hypothetical protein
MSVEQEVPAWAKDAVADGWGWCKDTEFVDKEGKPFEWVARLLASGGQLRIYRDGTGGRPFDRNVSWPIGPVSESLKLANQYAAANGGWA